MDCSPPGSSAHGILQVRILEWVAISFSGGSSRPRDNTRVSCLAGRFSTVEPPGKPYEKLHRTKLGLKKKAQIPSHGQDPHPQVAASPKSVDTPVPSEDLGGFILTNGELCCLHLLTSTSAFIFRLVRLC